MKTFKEYAEAAIRTFKHPTRSTQEQIPIFGLGLTGEAGEVADMIKKIIGHGHKVNIQNLTKELGDVLWYIFAIAEAYGIMLETVAEHNIIKLQNRYKDGFTEAESIGRKDAAPVGLPNKYQLGAALMPPRKVRVYVASKFEDWRGVQLAQAWVVKCGGEISYDWTPHASVVSPTDEQKAQWAQNELNAIRSSDALLVIEAHGMRGTYVEMGIAIGLGVPVYFVPLQSGSGERTLTPQVFEYLPEGVRVRADIPFAVEQMVKYDSLVRK